MKNKFCIVLTVFLTMQAFTACGSEKKEILTEYVQPAEEVYFKNLQDLGEVEVSLSVEEESETERYLAASAEADGSEETASRQIVKTCMIYSRPNEEANVLDTVASGAFIEVIGLLEEEDYYKIVYNGRIAYIDADSLQAEDEDNIVTQRTLEEGQADRASDQNADENLTDGSSSDSFVQGGMATENNREVSAQQPAPTGQPASTPEPAPTGQPASTPEPAPTGQPAGTPEPAPTRQPVNTTIPAVTEEPPVETPVPVPTEPPVGTSEPVPTEPPVETSEPVPTEPPAETMDPETPTESPAETVEPPTESSSETMGSASTYAGE